MVKVEKEWLPEEGELYGFINGGHRDVYKILKVTDTGRDDYLVIVGQWSVWGSAATELDVINVDDINSVVLGSSGHGDMEIYKFDNESEQDVVDWMKQEN